MDPWDPENIARFKAEFEKSQKALHDALVEDIALVMSMRPEYAVDELAVLGLLDAAWEYFLRHAGKTVCFDMSMCTAGVHGEKVVKWADAAEKAVREAFRNEPGAESP